MSITVEWVNDEKRILHYQFSDVWTWEQFYTVFDRAIAMGKSVPHRVDIVVDFSQCVYVAPNPLKHLARVASMQNPNAGLSIIVTTNRFLSTLYATGARIYPGIKQYFRVVGTTDEAYLMIEAERVSSTPA